MKEKFKGILKKHHRRIIKIISLVVLLGLVALVVVEFIPLLQLISTPEGRLEFQQIIGENGFWGWLLMLGIQILQIIVALIPGEPIEVIMGLIYGTWGGLFTCLLGILMGTLAIFFAVRKWGYPLVAAFMEKEKMKKFNFLHYQNTKRLEIITFLLFFIPGTPKDLLTYFAGLTTINPWRFFAIATLSRIPSVISSTYAGEQIFEGEIAGAIIIYGIIGVLGIGGILLNNKLMTKWNQKKAQQAQEGDISVGTEGDEMEAKPQK